MRRAQMLYTTVVRNRIGFEVEYHGYDDRPHPDRRIQDHFSGDETLLRAIEATRTQLLNTAQKMAKKELRLWRKVLRSRSTTSRGLRSAMQRIRGLCGEIDGEAEGLKKDLAVFHAKLNRVRAREFLEYRISHAKRYGNPFLLHTCDEYLKRRKVSYRDTGIKRSELEKLVDKAKRGKEELKLQKKS